MKSGVSYIVDVELDNDGMVCTTRCECAAGMGPVAQCKHVCTVLYGLTVYVAEGGLRGSKHARKLCSSSCCEAGSWRITC